MSVVRDTYDDEIDLFEFFEILWGGKWLIIGVSLLMGLIGFGYTKFSGENQYEVSVPYVVGIYSVASQQACGENVGCMENEVTKKLSVFLDSDWVPTNNGMLRRTTPQRPDVASYQADLERANDRITQEAYADATTELAWIENELNDDLLGTEIVATNVLNAKRVIAFIDGGGAVLTFGDISIEEINALKVVILFIVLGGIIGVFSVFFYNAIRVRNDNMANS